MTSKRSLKRRLAALEEATDDNHDDEAEPPTPWMANVPPDLWDDRVAAWRYFIEEEEPSQLGLESKSDAASESGEQ